MTIREEIQILCDNARGAAGTLALASTDQKNNALRAIAAQLRSRTAEILNANALDLEKAQENDVPKTMLDRLKLTEERIEGICTSIEDIVKLEDPIGKGEEWTRPSGIVINRVRAPLGVVAIIFEARPNVTVDSAVLCIKTGNAVILRGGKEAINTNIALVDIMKDALGSVELDPHGVELVKNTDRESAVELMTMRGSIDVLIPRGGKGLIKSVTENATVPVIETGAGNCHIYVDDNADVGVGLIVTENAKCSRPSVCNAVETVLVHAGIAGKFLPLLAEKLAKHNVQIRGCARTCVLIPSAVPATEEDYYTEYNDYIVAVKVVNTLTDAIVHINKYGTGHSDAIITRNKENAERFQKEVDSAAVYVNASTRFTDGGEFGFGAEIGISTQKLHIRGPMGLVALTTEKYLIRGNGSIRK